MTMVGLPMTLFQVEGADVGDLEYIESKVVASEYFQVSGDINATNDTIEFIVPSGKTAFLIEAKIIISTHASPPALVTNVNTIVSDRVQASLKIDSVVKDKTNIGIVMATDAHSAASSNYVGSGLGDGTIGDGRFNVLGLSLVGDGAKVIEIENTLNDGSAFATFSGYLSDT